MKGIGKPMYHLGADFFWDDDRTLCLDHGHSPLYEEPPKPVFSPLDHEDHPELDDSPLCGTNYMTKFQSLIRACQWMISLC